MKRRTFLSTFAAASLCPAASPKSRKSIRIGVTDWNLHQGANPESVAKAAQLGFEGVQISFGRQLVDGKMPVDRPEMVAQYLALSKQHGIAIDGTCVDKLHDNGLKSDPLALRWVSDAIRLTRALKTRVLLLPFFGRWAIQTEAEKEHIGDALRELAPEAEKAGAILGIENTISAEDNARILDRSRSNHVRVYYDSGNSTLAGFDINHEIRWLGAERICQFHFKDNPHLLGEGSIRFKPVVRSIEDIGWSGWINLETDARQGSLDADMRTNLNYVRTALHSAA